MLWNNRAISDLARLYRFLAPKAEQAAADAYSALIATPDRILSHPRMGERIMKMNPREVRRVIVGPYEMRYEVQGQVIRILRIWHGREDR